MQNNQSVLPANRIVLRSHGGVEQTTRSQNFRRRNLQRDADMPCGQIGAAEVDCV